MTEMLKSANPLVTFALFAYNQEKFIREAVEGALAQTYSPLEIILSDDCSSDRTFEIMREMAAAYQGPHSIILNRNPSNLGVGTHVNIVGDLANGAFIVLAAGDDVQMPQRTAVMHEAWKDSGYKLVSIYSAVLPIGECGESITTGYDFNRTSPFHCNTSAEVVAKDCCAVLGCSHGLARQLLTDFPKLAPEIFREDNVLPFRAVLRDGIIFINEPLLKYRHHRTNLASFRNSTHHVNMRERIARLVREYEDKRATRYQWLHDALSMGSDMPDASILRGLKRLAFMKNCQYHIAKGGLLASLIYIPAIFFTTGRLRGPNILFYRYFGRRLLK
jgi:glycosyltransferase involved in cell wall biosynthesis